MGPSLTALGQASALEAEGRLAPARLGERLAARGLISADAIEDVLERQRRWGCRFGEVLIADGIIKPIELAESLADSLGLLFVDLVAEHPDPNLIDAAHLDLYLLRLFVPWRQVGGVKIVSTSDPSPEFQRLAARLYGSNIRIVVTGKFDIIWTVQRLFRERLNHDAVFRLDERAPEFSARKVATARQKLFAAVGALALMGGLLAAPALAATLAILLLGLCYGANIILRLLLFAASSMGSGAGTRVTDAEIASLPDAELPVYSILVPLYREAHMVGRIVAALKNLDYPGLMAQTPQTQNLASARNFPNE